MWTINIKMYYNMYLAMFETTEFTSCYTKRKRATKIGPGNFVKCAFNISDLSASFYHLDIPSDSNERQLNFVRFMVIPSVLINYETTHNRQTLVKSRDLHNSVPRHQNCCLTSFTNLIRTYIHLEMTSGFNERYSLSTSYGYSFYPL